MNIQKPKEKGLPCIRCECGARILLLPDLNEMSRCIELHALVHAKRETNSQKAEQESSRIQDLLIKQIFQIVGQIKPL